MNQPLDGARLKVVWAQKDLDALKDEIGTYLDTHPYEFPVEFDGDMVKAASAVIKVEPPIDLTRHLSDCLGNLRASLDYIAWTLATRYSSTPPVAGKDTDIYFPIISDPDPDGNHAKRFAKMAQKYAFPTAAVDLIKSVQPYNAGYEPLKTLASLVNRDKHCLPLLTLAYAFTGTLSIIVDGVGIVSAGSASSVCVTRHTRAPEPPEQQAGNVKVDGQVTVYVSLKDSPVPKAPVDLLLGNIIKCVKDIVPRFEPFFP